MEAKKLERIIILILALVNLCLLGLLLRSRAEEAASRNARLEMATALLEENGITVDPGVDLLQTGPVRYTVVRDLELEEQRMQGLLGNHNSKDLGGGIWFYRSDRGQIVMRGTGEMDILPAGDMAARDGTPVEESVKLMQRAGVELWVPEGLTVDPERLPLCCCWAGCPVFNAVMEFCYSEARLDLVTGTMIFNRETVRDTAQSLDAVSLLVSFADTVRREGVICSQLSELVPGYIMTVGLNGESSLDPVWRLTTDAGELYVDALTGALTALPG